MPDTIVLFDNECITLVYHPNKKIIHHTIHQPICGEPLRAVLNQGTEALAEYGACKWLSDDRLNGAILPEDAEWGRDYWHARAIASGWKYWANVVPHEVQAAGTLNASIEHLFELGLNMMVFTTPDEAMEWLESRAD